MTDTVEPQGAPTSRRPSASEFRPISGLAAWVIRLTKFQIGVELIFFAGAAYTYDFVSQWKKSSNDYRGEDWSVAADTYENTQEIIGLLYLATAVVCLIVFLMWVYRSSHNARLIDPDPNRITPGWAVAWNFIPIANLWMPYIAVRQTWHSTHGSQDALKDPTPTPIRLWWIAGVASALLSAVTSRMTTVIEFDGYDSLAIYEMISAPVMIVSLVMIIKIVRTITEKQKDGPQSHLAEVFD